MKILGNRVYLLLPELPEFKTQLSPEFKKQQKEEVAKQLDKLTVYAVSENAKKDTGIEPGNEVLLDPNVLAQKRCSFFKLEDKEIISVSAFDILHIW
jgi:hypothetical protein